jgi:flagellar biosynthetic protein FlhB
MSDNEQDKDQKEFEATEQRRRDARRDGDVVQSKELNAFALTLGILISAVCFKVLFGGQFLTSFAALLYHADNVSANIFSNQGGSSDGLYFDLILAAGSLLLIPLALIALSILLQQSFVVSGKRIKPDIKKISPVSNFKKKYGKEGMTEFLKDAAKMLFAGAISTFFLWQFAQEYYASSAVQLGQFVDFTFSQVVNLIICFAAFQFCLAVVDFPLQRNLHAERIKMSREDLKKETKQSEGDPQLKQSRRQKAIQISKNDMLKQVETATVIMVNPTHYAVALRWDRDGGRAPVCVAKGVDNMAARIRELAIQHSVPIYSDPPSTRAIYKNIDIDEEIQDQHFGAVAAAIQFVEAIQLRD